MSAINFDSQHTIENKLKKTELSRFSDLKNQIIAEVAKSFADRTLPSQEIAENLVKTKLQEELRKERREGSISPRSLTTCARSIVDAITSKATRPTAAKKGTVL